MSKKPEALIATDDFFGYTRLICPPPILGYSARDGIVKASVQGSKIIRADGRVHFHCQVGNRLTHIAIVVNDL